jgi:uncharacterized protein YpmB
MKKIVWTGLVTVAIVTFAALFGLRELTYAQMPDLKAAAAYALDHSALFKIDRVKMYTGGPQSYVFWGEDKLGRKLIVFAGKESVLGIEYLDSGLKEEKVSEIARQQFGFTDIESLVPGIIDPNRKGPLQTDAKYVWEIYGTNTEGEKQYTYLDFYQGKKVWTYQLKPVK